jgi:hypothetical protein
LVELLTLLLQYVHCIHQEIQGMTFKHHLARKYHESKQAPLWKWIVIVFLVLALPLFFALVNTVNIQQVFGTQDVVQEGSGPA